MAKKPLLNRSFSPREKVLVLILVLIALVAFYYFAVVQNVADTKVANAEIEAELEQKIAIETAQAVQYTTMQKELDALKVHGGTLPVVAVYDNVGNELDELNSVLASTSEYNVSFSPPTVSGETVRRPATLTYTVGNYDEAINIVSRLLNGTYRCEVTDFSFTAKTLSNGKAESVSATLNLVFYETTKGANNTNGLTEEPAE